MSLDKPAAIGWMAAMTVDTILEDDRWQAVGLEALAETAARAALAQLGHDPDGFEIALLACDDARIAALNGAFRAKPRPTNVLSWPSVDLAPDVPGDAPWPPEDAELGDIALAYDTCAREAAEAGKPFESHLRHLVVHGVLHLLGFDHETEEDAARMEALEVEILGKLGDPSPY